MTAICRSKIPAAPNLETGSLARQALRVSGTGSPGMTVPFDDEEAEEVDLFGFNQEFIRESGGRFLGGPLLPYLRE
jgi:hypothetical protein